MGYSTFPTNVAIDGPGADELTIDAQGNSRVMHVQGGASLQISGLTLTGGNAGHGGGILAEAGSNTTLTGMVLAHNTATNHFDGGGGVWNEGEMTILSSTIRANSATGPLGRGGGIWNDGGTLTVDSSTISDNSVVNSGGGIFNNHGTLAVDASTISGNSAGNAAGGILSHTDLGSQTTTITHSTISGNSADRGGGVFNFDGLTVIEHSTLTLNAANTGSGVCSLGNSYTQTDVRSSIIAGNSDDDDVHTDGSSDFVSLGYNLIGGGNDSGAFTASGDQAGVTAPMLGVLADNGGPTQTHLLLPGSPAITAGDTAFAGAATDQRDRPRVIGGVLDIGAVEVNPPAVRDLGPLPAGVTNEPTYDLRDNEVVFYRLELAFDVLAASGASLVIDTEGSVLGDGSFVENDTELGLYDATGNLVATDDDGGTDRLSQLGFGTAGLGGDLTAGTYYVSVSGYNTNFVGADFAAVSTSAFAGSALVNFELQPPALCDFDGNGTCDLDDIDALVAEIAAGTNDLAFDLTGDALVNLSDRDQWLADAGALNLPSGNAYLLGDANLDGTVDGIDFLAWNDNKFKANGLWSGGDWNADGTTDGQDFIIWNNTKFQSADGAASLVDRWFADLAEEEEDDGPAWREADTRATAPLV